MPTETVKILVGLVAIAIGAVRLYRETIDKCPETEKDANYEALNARLIQIEHELDDVDRAATNRAT